MNSGSYEPIIIFLPFAQALYDGENPECVLHSLHQTQKKIKKETGREDVLKGVDVFNLARAIISAGMSFKFMKYQQNITKRSTNNT